MKNIKRLAVVAVLGLSVCGLAIAQVQRDGEHHGDPASVAEHISEFFPKIAAFDMNKDGKLDAAEKEALAKAIADGTLQFPAHTPPHGGKPNADVMLNHIAEVYSRVWKYDANHDGELNATERAALKSAIEKGELDLHGERAHDDANAHH